MAQYLGDISAYALAVSKGYTGTEEEFAALMASYASVAQQAAASAEAAEEAQEAAESARDDAISAKNTAQSAATTATTKAGEAASSASTASTAAGTATTKAGEASASAAAAGTSATNAANSANAAASSASDAAYSADDAAESATAAETAQGKAEDAQEAAERAAERLTIDSALSNSSENPVQNKVITEALDGKAPAIIETLENQAVASVADGADGMPVKSLVINIDPVQSGSGDPSPDNVRPITGWTGANIQRTGKNLLNLSQSEMLSSGWNRSFPFSIKAGPYIISCQNQFGASGNKGAQVELLDASNNKIKELTSYAFGSTALSEGPVTISQEEAEKTVMIQFHLRASGATFDDISAGNIQIELGSTATAYEPYQGTEHAVDWTDEAGTVYGGTLDVTTGLLTVTHGIVDMGNFTWIDRTSEEYGTAFFRGALPALAKNIAIYDVPDAICSVYLPKARYGSNGIIQHGVTGFSPSVNYLIVRDPTYADAATFRAAMSALGAKCTYELATPVTYQLTPTQVDMLLGSNNIWADAGDVASIEYPADTKLYIDAQVAALLATMSET